MKPASAQRRNAAAVLVTNDHHARTAPNHANGSSSSSSSIGDDDDNNNNGTTDHAAVSPSSLTTTTSIHQRLLVQTSLFPLLLLFLGLSIFTQSFFLSRTAVDVRSSCDVHSAGKLLTNALLGFEHYNHEEVNDVEYLRQMGWLSDGGNNNNIGGGAAGGVIDSNTNYGCWVPRRVDSMAILVVDALRFDFARDHLPLSVGSRLFTNGTNSINSSSSSSINTRKKKKGMSKLYRFMADPPTVTMQRLKGLTTGGLPTFADITGSFGGASIHEDSWIEQLRDVPWDRRRIRIRHPLSSLVEEEGVGMESGDVRFLQVNTRPQLAFVGDDTWFDLFPTEFDDCHPFPSFNTRDLDTVDNGCLLHLPRLLDGLVGLKDRENAGRRDGTSTNSTTALPSYELIVAHFLGVDHVGHTYGPNNPHMERKLHQMDVMLSDTLNIIDDAPPQSCIVALVLGDHGMTEDGNHGGGTSDEINAGLFVHFSPGCHEEDGGTDNAGGVVNGDELGAHSAGAFDAIHQIDLVPTISLLMGLPIPYANIGGLVPDLLPPPRNYHHGDRRTGPTSSSTPHIATALALNAAQVWNYLYTYSRRSRDLPKDKMRELKVILDSASSVYRDAISQTRNHAKANEAGLTEEEDVDSHDSTAYRQACVLFKLFLAESTDLGRQVWTQFNEGGMKIGIGILIAAWFMTLPLWKKSVRASLAREILFPAPKYGRGIKENEKRIEDGIVYTRRVELLSSSIFMIFYCGVLTFGNSYIDHEREIITFSLSVLCLLVFCRWCSTTTTTAHLSSVGSTPAYLPLVVALCSRVNDLFVSGHGMDPSIRLHVAHLPIVFLSSLSVLMILRIKWLGPSSSSSTLSIIGRVSSALMETIVVVCLACSWWDKRAMDHSRTGFLTARIAMLTVCFGILQSIRRMYKQWKLSIQYGLNDVGGGGNVEHIEVTLFRVMLFLVIVTGPSAASSAVFIVIQCAALRQLMRASGSRELAAPTLAAIWRLTIRHGFFATNHHCSFNHLQFSAAFVATNIFQFHVAGMSLFMNTFGWEILGSCLLLVYSRSRRADTSREISSQHISCNNNNDVWDWFLFFQWTEILASCLSVRMMKRHLMVWAIFAPRFMFAAVFSVLAIVFGIVNVLLSMERIPSTTTTNLIGSTL